MTDGVRTLFDEYTASFQRGEHPDPVAYLDRAGDASDELRDMIEAFLETAPPPDPDPALVAAMNAWIAGQAPILELRKARGAPAAEVVATLAAELDVAEPKRRKLARYYNRLENGLLDVTRVDGRVFEALAKALNVNVSDLLFARSAPPASAPAYLRSSREAEEVFEIHLDALVATDPADRDEVDELFEGAG